MSPGFVWLKMPTPGSPSFWPQRVGQTAAAWAAPERPAMLRQAATARQEQAVAPGPPEVMETRLVPTEPVLPHHLTPLGSGTFPAEGPEAISAASTISRPPPTRLAHATLTSGELRARVRNGPSYILQELWAVVCQTATAPALAVRKWIRRRTLPGWPLSLRQQRSYAIQANNRRAGQLWPIIHASCGRLSNGILTSAMGRMPRGS